MDEILKLKEQPYSSPPTGTNRRKSMGAKEITKTSTQNVTNEVVINQKDRHKKASIKQTKIA